MVSMVGEIWLLGGVTASGKTDLALSWAENNNAEIISCDSVAFYRGLDLGSAKPTPEEQERVPHHGLDLADVHEVFDVVRFHDYAKNVVQDIAGRGKKILVVGGSGFFLNGFLRPVTDGIEISAEVRQSIEEQYQSKGLSSLLEDLDKLNPAGVGIDIQNPVRVIRALERCVQTGKSLAVLQQEFERLPVPYEDLYKHALWLDRKEDELMERIHARTQKMVKGGILEEAEVALRQGIETHPSLSVSVGYREAIESIKNRPTTSSSGLVDSITRSTRQLVAKQRKWFRKHFPPDSCITLSDSTPVSDGALPWVRVLDRTAGSN